jgi:hypothetical protein
MASGFREINVDFKLVLKPTGSASLVPGTKESAGIATELRKNK